MSHDDETAQVMLARCDEPFEMLSGTYVRQRFAPHLHETYAVGVLERGAARLRYRGTDVIHRAGDVITLEPFEVHTGEPVDGAGWSYRMLYLPIELMTRFGADGVTAPTFAHSHYADADLATQMVAMHRLLETDRDVLRQASMLADTLHRLCERHADVEPRPVAHVGSVPLARVREYLEVHFAHAVTLAELAALAGVSPFHLIRQFRRAYGLPPYMYLELVRINRAKDMLRQGARISDVAYLTGFSDQSHLTRRFKRVVGVPPGQYARIYWMDSARSARLALPERRLA